MPPFAARPHRLCLPPTRRDWLAISAAALLGTRVQGKPKAVKPRAKSVLIVFTPGGMSQLETWDPKPNAAEEIRGAFGSIQTAVPGTRFGEHLPRVAKLADRFAVIRSMTHDDTDHGSACYLSLTGRFHPQKSGNPPPKATDFPTLGAVLHRVRPTDRFPASAVHLNGPILLPELTGPGNTGGFLGHKYDPLTVPDPTDTLGFVSGLTPDTDQTADRRGLLAKLDRTPDVQHTDSVRAAFDLLDEPRVRASFDLSREPEKVRDAYGRHRAGQACLLARRLVEAGVPWVTAFFNHNIRGQDRYPELTGEYGWDTHNDIFDSLKVHLLPRFDRTFAVLLQDLADRGLLKDTLVACVGEFGRSPRVALEKGFLGTSPGRKHWAACYSVVLAGAGVTPGAVYGASDRQAEYPQANPVTPSDLTATLFHALGIDPATEYTDPAGRPYRVAEGDPITGLFG